MKGYFTSDRFMLQVAKAARIASFKYPPERYDVTFVFDQKNQNIKMFHLSKIALENCQNNRIPQIFDGV